MAASATSGLVSRYHLVKKAGLGSRPDLQSFSRYCCEGVCPVLSKPEFSLWYDSVSTSRTKVESAAVSVYKANAVAARARRDFFECCQPHQARHMQARFGRLRGKKLNNQRVIEVR